MIEGQEGVTWEHWVALAAACEQLRASAQEPKRAAGVVWASADARPPTGDAVEREVADDRKRLHGA